MQDLRASTFKPQLCRKSEAIASRLHAVAYSDQPRDLYQAKQKPEDRLLQTAQSTTSKIEQKRSEQQLAEAQACTFKPTINRQSAQIAKSRSLGRGGKRQYESLFEEATQRHEVLEKQSADFYSKVCTFRPKITPPPPDIADRISQVDFMERGLQLLTKREESKRASQKTERRNPDIGQKSSRRPPHLDIHEYLYGFADKQKKELEDLRRSQALELDTKRSLAKSTQADKVIWEAMDKKLAALFTNFDVDGDGRITNADIEAVVLSSDMKALMQPLFDEAKLGNIDLGEQEFIEACRDLVKTSSVPQRYSLINQHLMTRRSSDYKGHAAAVGKPTINAVSNVLSYKDQYASVNVFDRLAQGRDKVVRGNRLQRRLTAGQSTNSARDSNRNDAHDDGEEEDDADYNLASPGQSGRGHKFEEDVVHEEDEDDADYN